MYLYEFLIVFYNQQLYQKMNELWRKSALFLVLTAGVYSCYLISGIYHQKILKKPYKHMHNQRQAYFTETLAFSMFPPLFAAIIGKMALFWQKQQKSLPIQKCLAISSIVNINLFTFNKAVMYASFPAVVMVKSCSLLSVIIVGVFFSRVKDSKLKLTHKKLLIGVLATIGIVLFNYSKTVEEGTKDHPIQFISLGNLFLIISLIGDGFLPDFQAELKSQHKPSAMLMYYEINKYTFLLSLTLALLLNRFTTILAFLLHYENFFIDMLKLSILNAIGQLFVYRMIKQFRQHVPAFVIALRKCLTVIVNIVWYGHLVNKEQLFGMAIVFVAVFWEVYCNYNEAMQKQKENRIQFMHHHEPERQIFKQSDLLMDALEDQIKQRSPPTDDEEQKCQDSRSIKI